METRPLNGFSESTVKGRRQVCGVIGSSQGLQMLRMQLIFAQEM